MPVEWLRVMLATLGLAFVAWLPAVIRYDIGVATLGAFVLAAVAYGIAASVPRWQRVGHIVGAAAFVVFYLDALWPPSIGLSATALLLVLLAVIGLAVTENRGSLALVASAMGAVGATLWVYNDGSDMSWQFGNVAALLAMGQAFWLNWQARR